MARRRRRLDGASPPTMGCASTTTQRCPRDRTVIPVEKVILLLQTSYSHGWAPSIGAWSPPAQNRYRRRRRRQENAAQPSGGARLLTILCARTATHMVILKLDSGFRSAADRLGTTERWKRQGVTLYIVERGPTLPTALPRGIARQQCSRLEVLKLPTQQQHASGKDNKPHARSE